VTQGQEGRDSENGALAIPVAGRGPGVVVIPEGWGRVAHVRDVCDRLAREGFVALAPDLYRGESPSDAVQAGRLMMDLDIPRAEEDLSGAVATLLNHEAVEGAKLGCIGFGMGGQLALQAASRSRRIAAAVDCYGIHPGVVLDCSEIEAAVLGIFAENDEFVPASAVDRLAAELQAAGVQTHFRTYSGVEHGFLNDSRPDVYAAAEAREAWNDILSFLRAEI